MNDLLSDTYSPGSLFLQILCPNSVVDFVISLFRLTLYDLISP